MAKAALIDLDGTLLPMDTPAFMCAFVTHIGEYCAAELGMDATALSELIWHATAGILAEKNPHASNADVFWARFEAHCRLPRGAAETIFARYYQGHFSVLAEKCSLQPLAQDLLRMLKERGYVLAVATNPIFPRVALEERLRWAGLSPGDFSYISDYHNSHSAKPNESYYEEILHALRADARQSVMIGNDATDDIIPARRLGMRCYFVTDYGMKARKCPKHVARGDFAMLLNWVRSL